MNGPIELRPTQPETRTLSVQSAGPLPTFQSVGLGCLFPPALIALGVAGTYGRVALAAALAGTGVLWYRQRPGPRLRRRRERLLRWLRARGYAARAGTEPRVQPTDDGPRQARLTGGAPDDPLVLWLALDAPAAAPSITLGRTIEGPFALGDPAFDAVVGVAGDPVALRAALDAATRRAWATAVADQDVRFEAGWLRVPLDRVPEGGQAQRYQQLDQWHALLRGLAVHPSAQADRLRAIAGDALEPPAARAAAFQALYDVLEPAPSGRAEALRALLDLGHGPLTVCLGELLGAEVTHALPAAFRDVRADIRRRAVMAYAASLDPSARPEALEPLLTHPHVEVRVAALDQLTRIAHPLHARHVAALHADPSPAVRHGLSLWFSTQPSPFATAGALSLLADPEPEVFESAARLLGRVGDLQCLPRLRAYEGKGPSRAVVEAAVARICERHAAGHGDLALVPEADAAGGLALADAAGGLALTEGPSTTD